MRFREARESLSSFALLLVVIVVKTVIVWILPGYTQNIARKACWIAIGCAVIMVFKEAEVVSNPVACYPRLSLLLLLLLVLSLLLLLLAWP